MQHLFLQGIISIPFIPMSARNGFHMVLHGFGCGWRHPLLDIRIAFPKTKTPI